jgi:transcriptional regulator with XRE-family HTH domain
MGSKIDSRIGNRVKETRRLRGVSQKRLGEALGLTFQQVQKYETGKNRIAAGTLYQIADFLKVDVASFYKGMEKPEKETRPVPRDILGMLWKLHGIRNKKIRASVSNLITVLHKELPSSHS